MQIMFIIFTKKEDFVDYQGILDGFVKYSVPFTKLQHKLRCLDQNVWYNPNTNNIHILPNIYLHLTLMSSEIISTSASVIMDLEYPLMNKMTPCEKIHLMNHSRPFAKKLCSSRYLG